ncbi:19098_t:CDS:2, partial [Gigaspora margarita]
PGHLSIIKRFLYPSWKTINLEKIQQTEIPTKYLVPSQKNKTQELQEPKLDQSTSSPKIQVQVELVKCKKVNKDNCNPYAIPTRKV